MKLSWKNITVLVLLAVGLIVIGFFAHHQNNNLQIREISIFSSRVDGLSIVHLSDLHGKQFGKNNETLLSEIELLEPELIVLTGDMIGSLGDREEIIQFSEELVQIAPVFAVFGNHEPRGDYRIDFKNSLEEKGIRVLDNEIATIEISGNVVNIVGFDENNLTREHYKVHVPLLTELEQLSGLRIVLTHYPQEYSQIGDASFEHFDFDLMFAGHAHGGQWIFPGIGGLYAPGQGFLPRYYRGLYDCRLIVSPGLGNSYFPLRLFNYPEIINLKVNP